jgi:hypothetical protein
VEPRCPAQACTTTDALMRPVRGGALMRGVAAPAKHTGGRCCQARRWPEPDARACGRGPDAWLGREKKTAKTHASHGTLNLWPRHSLGNILFSSQVRKSDPFLVCCAKWDSSSI